MIEDYVVTGLRIRRLWSGLFLSCSGREVEFVVFEEEVKRVAEEEEGIWEVLSFSFFGDSL